MATKTRSSTNTRLLAEKAARLRTHSILATSAAGSGHPSSCASAADIVATLFFHVMRYDPANPKDPRNDRFILSKGHAAPLLYAAWAEAGYLATEDLLSLRRFTSPLEGHPTPGLPFVDVATGSLGQGLSAGVGMAIAAGKLGGMLSRIYVLMGDGETAEGAVWEAVASAKHYGLSNLCAIVDVNRLGQSQPTDLADNLTAMGERWRNFGWNVVAVDGHSVEDLAEAFSLAEQFIEAPTVLIARTLKGKGIPAVEDKDGFHGKPLTDPQAREALESLQEVVEANDGESWKPTVPDWKAPSYEGVKALPDAPYRPGDDPIATRKATAQALTKLGEANRQVIVFDGDVKNSTYTELFEEKYPDRFFQMFIAEQNMAGAAMGASALGYVPFLATFACFLTRAYDFFRMAGVGRNNIKIIGTHAGVSIGEDGPSQMGLEDLAMFGAIPDCTVLYPCDATSAWNAVSIAAQLNGPVYIRATRPNTPVIYAPDEVFESGKGKVLRESRDDTVTVVAAGITLHEALKASDELQSEGISARIVDLFSFAPIDRELLQKCARESRKGIITVEDHYRHGGIGDAVLDALSENPVPVRKLAIGQIPRSGEAAELLGQYGISASHIVRVAREMANA